MNTTSASTRNRRVQVLLSHIKPTSFSGFGLISHQPTAGTTAQAAHSNIAFPNQQNNKFPQKLFSAAEKPVLDIKQAWFKWLVVNEGQVFAVWRWDGNMEIIKGPNTTLICNGNYAELKWFSAIDGEYLVIRELNGSVKHVTGPCSVFYNPKEHLSIGVERAIRVENGQAIILYERQKDEKVLRKVVKGPSVVVPQPNQWVHRFFWQIPNQKQPTIDNRQLLKFRKLRLVPDQVYFNAENIRTKDDALITVELMIFFHLQNVDQMFENTHDPVAELVNSITADIVDFAGVRTFEQFKHDTEQLNTMDVYKHVKNAAKKMGYEIIKVVYRGYRTSSTLQAMHNGAIETRTQLALENETEQQKQNLEDFRITRKASRLEQEMKLKEDQAKHEQQMLNVRLESDIKRRQLENDNKLKERAAAEELAYQTRLKQNDQEQNHARAMNSIKLEYLKQLSSEAGVDVTKYLIAQHQHPDKIFRVENVNEGKEHKGAAVVLQKQL